MSPNQNPLPVIKSTAAVILVLAAHFGVTVPTEDISPTSNVEKRVLSPLVSGSPPGFASNTTGGGTASPLTTYLTSSSPQVIVLSGTYDFAGSEGTVTKTACNAYSCTPAQGGQALLNTLNGCASNLALYDVNIDQAAFSPIWVRSDKTVVGTNGATIKGKGFRLSGVANIIFQNIHVTELNPAYVWGGDAFALTDTSNVWIDHVTYHDREKSLTATLLVENHVYLLSGRGPALSGNTLWHAVNNVWSSSRGHLIEGTDNAMGVYEGNYFQDCPTIVGIPLPSVRLFTSVAAEVGQCASRLGRNCVPNLAVNSSAFSFSNLDALASFAGKSNIPAAHTGAWTRDNVVANAGNVL
ncbi:polysaccharide lyase family 1 protein [Diplocarpon rosae]|nr:polysaccharide lyase family 1 protein [Diplocarpon rosae]